MRFLEKERVPLVFHCLASGKKKRSVQEFEEEFLCERNLLVARFQFWQVFENLFRAQACSWRWQREEQVWKKGFEFLFIQFILFLLETSIESNQVD